MEMSGVSVAHSDPDTNYNLHVHPTYLICMCFSLLQINYNVVTRAVLNTPCMQNAGEVIAQHTCRGWLMTV